MEREDSVGRILWRATETGRVLSSKGCVYLGVSQKHVVRSIAAWVWEGTSCARRLKAVGNATWKKRPAVGYLISYAGVTGQVMRVNGEEHRKQRCATSGRQL